MIKRHNRTVERWFILILCAGCFIFMAFFHQCDESPIDTKQLDSTEVSPPATRYLWCVNHYGPNSQLKDVVKCIMLAMMFNFTMILPPIQPHFRDTTRGIQRFEHFHNIDKLKHIVNLITLEEFMAKTEHDQQSVTIDCYVHHSFRIHTKIHYGDHTLKAVENYFNTTFTFNRNLNVSAHFRHRELLKVTKSCSSIYLYMRFEWTWNMFTPLHRYAKRVMEYWDRSVWIHRHAEEAMEYLRRTFSNNQTADSSMIIAVAHLRRGDHNVMKIDRYGTQLANLLKTGTNFTHLYIMCPFLKTYEIKILQRIIAVPLLTTDVLTKHLKVIMDEFMFDVVEQELGFHAPIFIGSPLSTYSATIYLRKIFQNKGESYLFTRKSTNIPMKLTKDNAEYFDTV